MILRRFLLKEVVKAELAVFSVLMVVFVSRELVSVLADASEGKIAGDMLLSLLGLTIPKLTMMILPLSLFLGILMAYGRMYADSEMVVIHGAGVSEWFVTRITLIVALLNMLVVGGLTLYWGPWAEEMEKQLIDQAKSETNTSLLTEGQFRKSSDGNTVIFVEAIREKGKELEKVFVAQMPDTWDGQQKASLVNAASGTFEIQASGQKELVLSSGARYEGAPGRRDYNIVIFRDYRIQVSDQSDVERSKRKINATPTAELLNDDSLHATAEFHWRIALPLSLPILTLIAVPMAAVNPRQGKFAKLFPAILLYLSYYVLLMAGRKALENGGTPEALGLWWVHLSGLAAGVFMVLNGRESGNRIRALLLRRSH